MPLNSLPTHSARRWSFHSQGHQVHPPQQHQAKGSLLLSLWHLRVLWSDLAKLFTVCQHKIHVAVKREEGANKDPSIQQDDPNTMVHVLH